MMRIMMVSLVATISLSLAVHVGATDVVRCCDVDRIVLAAIEYSIRRTSAYSPGQLLNHPRAYRDTIENLVLVAHLCQRKPWWVRVEERRLDARIVAVVCCDGTRLDTLAFGQDVMEVGGVEYEIDTTLLHGVAAFLPEDHRRSIDEEFRRWYRK